MPELKDAAAVHAVAQVHAHADHPVLDAVAVPRVVVAAAWNHPVDASHERADGAAAGQASDECKKPGIVGEEVQKVQRRVWLHAHLDADVSMLRVGENGEVELPLHVRGFVRVDERRQPDAMSFVELGPQPAQIRLRPRQRRSRSGQLQHDVSFATRPRGWRRVRMPAIRLFVGTRAS